MSTELRDLSDERRAAKTWLPASDKDVTEGRVFLRYFDVTGRGSPYCDRDMRLYPACWRHGAMHRLTIGAHLWRCGECGVGCEYSSPVGPSPSEGTPE